MFQSMDETEVDIRKVMAAVEGALPPGYAYAIVVTPFGEIGTERAADYVSNANRRDVVALMRLWIEHSEREGKAG